MGDISAIQRKPTPEELRNYTPVGFITIEKEFRKERIAKEQEYVKLHKPYCARCADLDFTDMWEDKKKELARKVSKDGLVDETKIAFSKPDLDKYGDMDRFEKKTESPIIREVVVDGVKVPKLVGHYHEYECKIRGCGMAVSTPLQDFTSEPKKLDEEKVAKTQ